MTKAIPLQSVDETALAIRRAIQEGRREEARVLATALRIEWPEDKRGWLWSALLHESAVEALLFAQRAAEIEPDGLTERTLRWASRRAERPSIPPFRDEQLLKISRYLAPPAAPLEPPPASVQMELSAPDRHSTLASLKQRFAAYRGYLPALALLAVVLTGSGLLVRQWLVPASAPQETETGNDRSAALAAEASRLWKSGDREAALQRWKEAYHLAPEREQIRRALARTHVAISSEHLRQNAPALARPHLEAAYELMPDETVVKREYQALLAYEEGQEAIAAKNWSLAVEILAPLYNLDPDYLDVRDQMRIALTGEQQTEAERRARQGQALSRARMAEPGRTARALIGHSDEIYNLPGQNTLPPLNSLLSTGNKHIVVSIKAQRMYVYENGRLVWDWPASTGEEEMPTVPGHYRIQSKIDRARSDIWSLWMPYWQGIYWVGSIENGIHGQVIFDDGGRLWDGYLGTQITFGCVMIGDEQAEKLFDWTELGTAVSILADWPRRETLPACPAGTTDGGLELPCYNRTPASGGG